MVDDSIIQEIFREFDKIYFSSGKVNFGARMIDYNGKKINIDQFLEIKLEEYKK